MNPKDWPPDDRIDVIGQNGNTGEHYDQELAEYEREQHVKNHLAKIRVKAHNCNVRHTAALVGASWRDHWCRTLKERGIDGLEYCKECEDD